MEMWVSDQDTHFTDEIIDLHFKEYGTTHHFTTAYPPRHNGTVESFNRKFMSACRTLSTETKLGPHEWHDILPTPESIINEGPNARLERNEVGVSRSPLDFMTGINPRRELLRGATGIDDAMSFQLDRIRAENLVNINNLQEEISKMHKQVSFSVSRSQARQMKAQKRASTSFYQTVFLVTSFSSAVGNPNFTNSTFDGPVHAE